MANKQIPLPSEGVGSFEWWKGQIDWSTDTRKELLPKWRKNARAYCDELEPPRADGIRVNIEYEKTEQKRWQLFFRMPAIKLRPHPRTIRDATPEPPADPTMQGEAAPPRDLKKAIAIFREVLSMLVGPDGANMKPTMDELIFDVLCPSGIAFAKVGYERHTDGQIQVETGAQIPDPNFVQPGAVLGIAGVSAEPPTIAEVMPAPNVIAENYYFERISPARGLVPADFTGSDYSGKAAFLGHDFDIAPEEAKSKGWNIPASAGSGSDVDDGMDRIVELKQKGNRKGQLRGREIFYYAARVDPSVKHPKKIRRLVFIDNADKPVVHEDSVDQKWDERGRLIGGIETLPIKVLTLHYVSDLAYPPSDCSVTRKASDELAEFRTGQIEHRRKAIPRSGINIDMIADDKIKDRVLRGKHYDDIPISGNAQNFIAPLAYPDYPNDNWKTEDKIMDQINRAWSLGANQSGVTEGGGTTATEIASINQATANRLGGEREKVVSQFWIDAVKTFAQLAQLYADQEDYVEIVGEQGAKTLEAWNKETLQGKWIFEAVPDSSMPPDAQGDRDLALNWHNLTANNPFFDQEQNARLLAEAFNQDADRLIKKPEPPAPPQPEPVKVTVSMKLEDLLPGNPLAEIGLALLQSANVTVAASTETPEPIKPAPVVDRERLRMAESDNADQRAGGLVGAV